MSGFELNSAASSLLVTYCKTRFPLWDLNPVHWFQWPEGEAQRRLQSWGKARSTFYGLFPFFIRCVIIHPIGCCLLVFSKLHTIKQNRTKGLISTSVLFLLFVRSLCCGLGGRSVTWWWNTRVQYFPFVGGRRRNGASCVNAAAKKGNVNARADAALVNKTVQRQSCCREGGENTVASYASLTDHLLYVQETCTYCLIKCIFEGFLH